MPKLSRSGGGMPSSRQLRLFVLLLVRNRILDLGLAHRAHQLLDFFRAHRHPAKRANKKSQAQQQFTELGPHGHNPPGFGSTWGLCDGRRSRGENRKEAKRPGAPGVSAAAITNARQSNATSLRAWII